MAIYRTRYHAIQFRYRSNIRLRDDAQQYGYTGNTLCLLHAHRESMPSKESSGFLLREAHLIIWHTLQNSSLEFQQYTASFGTGGHGFTVHREKTAFWLIPTVSPQPCKNLSLNGLTKFHRLKIPWSSYHKPTDPVCRKPGFYARATKKTPNGENYRANTQTGKGTRERLTADAGHNTPRDSGNSPTITRK